MIRENFKNEMFEEMSLEEMEGVNGGSWVNYVNCFLANRLVCTNAKNGWKIMNNQNYMYMQ